jgi:SAM-dependent methyltransferase
VPVDEAYDAWAGRDERVFVHLPLERTLLHGLPSDAKILDLGCGDGSHMELLTSGGRVIGMDVSFAYARQAHHLAPVVVAAGENLPFADASFDLVYLSHVLHHAIDHRAVLSEVERVLRSGGALMLIETCEDNPLMRLARRLRPEWESVPVRSRFRFAELLRDVRGSGLSIESSGQYNVLYWVWGFARRRIRLLERLIRVVIRVELAVARPLRRFSAYGYVIARASPRDRRHERTLGKADAQPPGEGAPNGPRRVAPKRTHVGGSTGAAGD